MRHIRALPVLMYHSVAPPGSLTPHQWLEWISVSVDLFEATLMDWDQRGVRTVGSEEFRGFLDGRFRLPRNRVVLTFDDGYLDNWVAVTPLLERYGQKAIVFITTDFIDPSGELRPTIKESPSPVKWQGYLSIPELRAMAASGHIEIQSHAMTHTWEFVSPEIVDFYGPHLTMDQVGCDYRFLWLNRNRALKPFALQHLRREAVAWGTPVYRFAPALVARRYRPDPDIETKLVETVAREG
ncbi:MAG: polysaccharide deacetylase family protein, partial [Acidobacteriota bacterium]